METEVKMIKLEDQERIDRISALRLKSLIERFPIITEENIIPTDKHINNVKRFLINEITKHEEILDEYRELIDKYRIDTITESIENSLCEAVEFYINGWLSAEDCWGRKSKEKLIWILELHLLYLVNWSGDIIVRW